MKHIPSKLALVAGFALAMAYTISCSSDGFRTVKIGNQVWMAENLNIDIQGSKCYEDNPENCKKYGRLYYYGIAVQACPKGWHLPSDKEWQMLVDFVGAEGGKKLKAKEGWKSGNGTDEYGFSALPGGIGFSDGSFDNVGKYGLWWSSSTEDDASYIYYRSMGYNGADVNRNYVDNARFLSVRCVQDN